MTTPNADALATHFATILFHMQQAVQATGSPTVPANPQKALGLMAPAWLESRKLLGPTVHGQWPSLPEYVEAVKKALLSGAPVAVEGLSADMDFDMGAWDPAAGTCGVCGTVGARAADGACATCGARS